LYKAKIYKILPQFTTLYHFVDKFTHLKPKSLNLWTINELALHIFFVRKLIAIKKTPNNSYKKRKRYKAKKSNFKH